MYKTSDKLKYILFKTIFTPLCIIIIFLFMAIALLTDTLLFSSETSKLTLSGSSACSIIERNLLSDITLLDNLSTNYQLKSTLRNINDNNYLTMIDDINKTNNTLDIYNLSHPEITNIIVFSSNLTDKSHSYNNIYPVSLLTSSRRFSSYADIHSAIITEGAPHPSPSVADDSLACDKTSVALITKIQDSDGYMYGYLCVALSKDYFYSNYLANTDPNVNVLLTNNTGNIIIAQKAYSLDSSLGDEFARVFISSGHGYYITKINGERTCVIYSAANSYGQRVISYIPMSNMCPWRKYVLLVLMLAIVLAFAAVYSYSLHFSHKITRPIAGIVSAMQSSSKCAENQSVYEFDNLVRIYNNLLDDLKEQSEKTKDAEIKSLLAQINPHFLYNTLNAIGWHALDGNPESTCKMLSKLSSLCKINYNFTNTTTIDKELVQINLYLDLQQECFNKTFEFTIDSPPDCGKYVSPSFILQPIVENSIIHGFSQINRRGELSISIGIADNIVIMIKDNGCGIPREIMSQLNSNEYHSEKYGIYNINNRIKAMCGSEYGITYTGGSSWTTAKIVLPIKFLGDKNV